MKFLAFHPEYLDFESDKVLPQEPKAAVELRLTAGLVIEGVVLDDHDGQPVADVEILVTSGDVLPRETAITRKDGRFRFAGISEGPGDLAVRIRGQEVLKKRFKWKKSDAFDAERNNLIELRIDAER